MNGDCTVLDTIFITLFYYSNPNHIFFSAKTIKLGLGPDDYLDFVKEDAQLR